MPDEQPIEGYVSPDVASIFIKVGGEWVEFIAKTEALLYVRFKDYYVHGEDLIFVTLDRQRAFEIQESDDVSDYDRLHIWRDGKCVQKWRWTYEDRWEVEWTDERAQEVASEEADAEPGSAETEAHPE